MSHPFEALDCFKDFLLEVQNQIGKKIKILRTRTGGEHLFHHVKQLCEKKRTDRIISTSQQNGVADRTNCQSTSGQ